MKSDPLHIFSSKRTDNNLICGAFGRSLVRFNLALGMMLVMALASMYPARAGTEQLTLGNLVWNDANGNGLKEEGEPGIPGVSLYLYKDNDDGVFGPGDNFIASAFTDQNGQYQFIGFGPGAYFVRVDGFSFAFGRALAGYVSSPGAANADNDIDNDDNGVDQSFPQNQGITSTLIALGTGTEPDVEIDGDDSNGNQTVDFGFHTPPSLPEGRGISVEEYRDIPGVLLRDLYNSPKFPHEPDLTGIASMFEWPAGSGTVPPPSHVQNNYGVRIRGFIHPPTSGEYVFSLASDDQGALWLSSDDSPANKVQIASEPQWNPVRAFTTPDRRELVEPGTLFERRQNVSRAVYLEAGRKYYVEAQMKEGGGGDNLAVAWKVPGGREVADGSAPISGEFLAPFDWEAIPPVAPFIVGDLADRTVAEGHTATFSVQADGTPSLTFQWRRNGVDIAGATGPVYTTPRLTLSDHGAVYSVLVSNQGGANTVSSREALLTVISSPSGSTYEFVMAPRIPWDEARVAAEQRLLNGIRGHLAIITTSDEDYFVEILRQSHLAEVGGGNGEFWIGGYQDANQESPGDGWWWLLNQGGIPGFNDGPSYANWHVAEPNDYPNSIEDNQENHLAVGKFGNFGGWNDEGNLGNIAGYVIEYDRIDNTPPAIVLNGPNPLTLECTAEYVEAGATVTDDIDPNPTLVITGSATSHTLGNYIVTYTATDASGNVTTATRTVVIVDTIAPVISLPAGDLTVECDGTGNIIDLNAWLASQGGAVAQDGCSEITWSNDFVGLSDDCGGTGSATVTFTATDSQGNSSSTKATFTIIDTTPPALTWVLNDAVADSNVPQSMTPNQAPLKISVSAADVCGPAYLTPLKVTAHALNGAGKRIDKSDSVLIDITNNTISINSPGGVGTIITVIASALDACGNSVQEELVIEVQNPSRSPANEGVGNGADGDTAGSSHNGGNDIPPAGPGEPGAKNKK